MNDQSVVYMCRFFSQFRSVTCILSTTRTTEQWGSRRVQGWGAPSTLWWELGCWQGQWLRQLWKSPPDFTAQQVLHKLWLLSSQKWEGSDPAVSVQKSDSGYPVKIKMAKANQQQSKREREIERILREEQNEGQRRTFSLICFIGCTGTVLCCR